jgi:ABC-type uncharacterized transport system fused permease/ATPase subunit
LVGNLTNLIFYPFMSVVTTIVVSGNNAGSVYCLYFLVYGAAVGLIFVAFASTLEGLQSTVLAIEGRINHAHARIVTFAESIAFFGGEAREKAHANRLISQLLIAKARVSSSLHFTSLLLFNLFFKITRSLPQPKTVLRVAGW